VPRPDHHCPWCHERLCGAYLERAVKALRQHGRVVDEGLPPYVAPIHWNHINLDRGLHLATNQAGGERQLPFLAPHVTV